MEPELSYARSADGTTIAYVSTGPGTGTGAGTGAGRAGEAPALVWLPAVPFSNLLAEWQVPPFRAGLEQLARRVRLVRYDGRGTGRSQHEVTDFSLDAYLGDLAAVVDAAGIGSFALLGYYHSCMPALAYAARNPDRVTRLVLFGGSARGFDAMSPPETQALLTLLDRDWDLFVETAALAWMGWSAGEAGRLVGEAFRTATTPAIARATLAAAATMNVSGELGRVQAPTLVLHRQGERQIPISVSRALADAIPNGRLQLLEGSSAALFVDGPGEDVRVILEFLTDSAGAQPAQGLQRRAAPPNRALTPRESEVLRLVAQGETNAEIARRLELSVNTVERHVANVYRKIDARGRADATAYAVRRGLA